MLTAFPHITRFQTPDGYWLHARVWRSQGPPVARIVGLHGIISHSGWYARSCAHLAAAGCEVHFLDRRGSGLNALHRGDIDGWRTWLDDVENYLDRLPPDVPRFLMGISWGGKLAAAVAQHRPWLLHGLMLLCPGIHARTKASELERTLLKAAHLAHVRERRVAIPLQDPALFIEDPVWQRYIASDPLVLRTLTLRFAYEDLNLDAYISNSAARISVPTLLMLAGRDQIIDNRKMREYFDQLGCSQRQLKEYPRAAHTLEFEPDAESVFCDLVDWVRTTLQRPKE